MCKFRPSLASYCLLLPALHPLASSAHRKGRCQRNFKARKSGCKKLPATNYNQPQPTTTSTETTAQKHPAQKDEHRNTQHRKTNTETTAQKRQHRNDSTQTAAQKHPAQKDEHRNDSTETTAQKCQHRKGGKPHRLPLSSCLLQ